MIKRIVLGALALAALGALLAATTSAGAPLAFAKAKPGFLPGVWIGKGTISGQTVDGPITSTFSGGVTFTLEVAWGGAVTGSGRWNMKLVGVDSDPENGINSQLTGSAALELGGTATEVTFEGSERVVGQVTLYGKSRPINLQRENTRRGRLVIGRAGKCRVSGVAPIQPGVTLAWSAQLEGSGTCNA